MHAAETGEREAALFEWFYEHVMNAKLTVSLSDATNPPSDPSYAGPGAFYSAGLSGPLRLEFMSPAMLGGFLPKSNDEQSLSSRTGLTRSHAHHRLRLLTTIIRDRRLAQSHEHLPVRLQY